MGDKTPRLRMFAGPNGSGKSSIKDVLPTGMLGFYVNADEIEKVIRKQYYFDLGVFQLETTAEAILGFFHSSEFLKSAGLLPQAQQLTLMMENCILAASKSILTLPQCCLTLSAKNYSKQKFPLPLKP